MAAEFADPPGESAELEEIGGQGAGCRVLQFRIEPGLMGVAVMPLVIAAIEIGVVEAQDPGQPSHRVVEAAAGEVGAVAALVHGAKAERQASAQEDQSGQPQWQRTICVQPNRSAQRDQRCMADRSAPPRCIAASIEFRQLVRRDQRWAGRLGGHRCVKRRSALPVSGPAAVDRSE